MTIVDFFREVPEAAVAFSGGVDSAALLALAARHARRTKAYFVRTPFQPAFELQDAEDTARRLGAELQVIDYDILAVPAVAGNPPDRCYHCKRSLFTALLAAAKADGFPVVLDGSNASDDAGDRPGMRALRELEVRSPLRECGITKDMVRSLSRKAGLFTWEKPAYACLATRVPTGTKITREDLQRAEQAEMALMALGFRDFRVGLSGGGARLQMTGDQMSLAVERRNDIMQALKPLFPAVFLDLEERSPSVQRR